MKCRCGFGVFIRLAILFILMVSQNGLSGEKISVVPNPYDSRTETGITFFNTPARAKITVFDVTGKRLTVLSNHSDQARDLHWDTDLAFGVFIYVTEYDGKRETGKFYIM